MKKLLTVSLLGVLLSIPSVVFAEASWYGSIRAGLESDATNSTGVQSYASRWGIRGSNEVSEGLTAVYQYEQGINATNAAQGGRLSYIGLSGGFGTVTIGQIWNATYNHFGGIVDQPLWYGKTGSDTGLREGNAVSYAVSVGNVSLQADAIMDQSTGKTGDGFNFGATLGGLMETGSIAIAHKKNPDDETVTKSSTYVAANYGVGDMTLFAGYHQMSEDDSSCSATSVNANAGDDCYTAEITAKVITAGVHGGVGDTGVSYVFAMRNEKVTADGFDDADDNTGTDGVAVSSSGKSNPWTIGLSRSLGGGASVKFEHSEPDTDADSSTSVWLQVNF